MADIRLFIPILISFFVTLFILPFWIRKAKEIGLVWEDMNKFEGEKVSGSGGIVVMMSFVIGVLIFVAYRVFELGSTNSFLVEIFALLTVMMILASVGFIDDLMGWRKGGLSRRSRMILVLLAAIPLIVINAGKSVIVLPFFGSLDVGLVYPFIFIPLGIVGATTTFNFLAGFNGLESGQGILILSALVYVSIRTGNSWLAIIALCMVFSLIAFLLYNFSPARVFPGDALTYGVGGLIACMAILGNFEKIAIIFFIPTIIEVFLKGRGKFVKQSFGKPNEDGSISLRENKIYSLNHLSIFLMGKAKVKPTEIKVVLSIWIFQIIVILIGLLTFKI